MQATSTIHLSARRPRRPGRVGTFLFAADTESAPMTEHLIGTGGGPDAATRARFGRRAKMLTGLSVEAWKGEGCCAASASNDVTAATGGSDDCCSTDATSASQMLKLQVRQGDT